LPVHASKRFCHIGVNGAFVTAAVADLTEQELELRSQQLAVDPGRGREPGGIDRFQNLTEFAIEGEFGGQCRGE